MHLFYYNYIRIKHYLKEINCFITIHKRYCTLIVYMQYIILKNSYIVNKVFKNRFFNLCCTF